MSERETITTPGGSVADYDGPTAASVARALERGGHRRSVKGKTAKSIPSTGFVVLKPRDVAYVEVWATMRGFGSGYATTLRRAGFIVEDNRYHPGRLVVFKAPAA